MSFQIALSQPVVGFRIEHRLDSLHFTVYECIRHRLPPSFLLEAIVQAYRTLTSCWTPFAVR